MIGALSQIYRVPVTETLRELMSALEFPSADKLLRGAAYDQLAYDPGRHASMGQQDTQTHTGESIDPTATRIRDLEDRLKTYQAIIRKVRKLGAEFLALAGDSDEGREASRGEPRLSGRDRKPARRHVG